MLTHADSRNQKSVSGTLTFTSALESRSGTYLTYQAVYAAGRKTLTITLEEKSLEGKAVVVTTGEPEDGESFSNCKQSTTKKSADTQQKRSAEGKSYLIVGDIDDVYASEITKAALKYMTTNDKSEFKGAKLTINSVKQVRLLETIGQVRVIQVQVDIAYGSSKNEVASRVLVAESEDRKVKHITLGKRTADDVE